MAVIGFVIIFIIFSLIYSWSGNIFISALLVVGIVWICSNSEKKDAGETKTTSKVDWSQVKTNIQEIKAATRALQGAIIMIQSEREEAYAEIIDSGYLYRLPSTDWLLSFTLDVSESFLRKHVNDYVSLKYPCESKWVNELYHKSIVRIVKSSGSSDHCCFLECYIGVPKQISEKEIKWHVGNLL